MKRVILLFSILLFSTYTILAQSLSTETFSEANENLPLIGSNFDVPIDVDGFGELLTLTIYLDYDPTVISYTGFADASVSGVEVTQPTASRIKVLVGNFPASTTIPNGTLVNLQFDYHGGNSDLAFPATCNYLTTGYVTVPITDRTDGEIIGGSVDNIIVDGDWEDPTDWSLQFIPNAFHNVFVQGMATIDSDALTNNLTIEVDGRLTVSAGASLAVDGDVLIDSDASGTGSFVNYGSFTVAGVATVKQFMSGSLDWHLVAVPVNTVESYDVFLNCYLQTWNEVTGLWEDVQTDTTQAGSQTLNTPMKGYSAAFHGSADKMLEFSGALNDGAYSIPVTNIGPAVNQGWNLVGNPYPSALDVDAPSGWTRNGVSHGVAYWDESIENYRYYGAGVPGNGGSQYVPPMQGFFVKASGGGGNIGVANAARTHTMQNFYKSDPANTLRLLVQTNDYSDETVIRFMDGAGIDYNEEYDFFKLFVEDVPQLYSITSASESLAINALPAIDEDVPVHVGLAPGVNATMSLTASGLETFDSSIPVWLYDRVADVHWNLRENPVYSFAANTGDDENRFSIHFKNLTGVSVPDQLMVNIYAYDKQIYVDAGTGNKGEIIVLNVLGQELARERLTEQLNVITLPVSNSYVVVKVISDQGISSRKVFVN
jgi:hypothetical protein